MTLPNATAEGNQLVIMASADDTVSTPIGFTLDESVVSGNAHYIFRKATTAGETSWTLTPRASTRLVWWAAELTGLQTSPVDVSSSNVDCAPATVSSGSTSSLTPTSGPRFIVASIGRANETTAVSTDAPGYSNSFAKTGEAHSNDTTPAVINASISVGTRSVTANGSTVYSTGVSLPDACVTGIIIAYKQ